MSTVILLKEEGMVRMRRMRWDTQNGMDRARKQLRVTRSASTSQVPPVYVHCVHCDKRGKHMT